MITAAIIVAAGRGTRAGGDLPKQWQPLKGRQVASYAIQTFLKHPQIHQVVVVMSPEDISAGIAPEIPPHVIVSGGDTRKQSVLAGLKAVDEQVDTVLIHDAARPLVTHDTIDRVLRALKIHQGAAPAVAVTDTLWQGADDRVTGLQDRSRLYRAQTPQGFHLAPLLAAHHNGADDATDDVAVARAAGMDIAIVDGDEDNIKITTPGDFSRAVKLLGHDMDVRCGNGYDVHRFGEGDHVWLCGVQIPHGRGLQGHSDADVGMHAVTDAIYGALGKGDIGQHFPPSDPQWKGAESHIFLSHAVAMARELGFQISNVDCTLVCEYPKIGPHQTEMKTAPCRHHGHGF